MMRLTLVALACAVGSFLPPSVVEARELPALQLRGGESSGGDAFLAIGTARKGGDTVRLLDQDLGGGDGVLTGLGKAVAFGVIGAGVGAVVIGALLIDGTHIPEGQQNPALGGTLIGAGALAALAGILVLSGVNCIACSTCGLAENDKRDDRGPREAFAGRDERRAVPGAPLVAGWGGAF